MKSFFISLYIIVQIFYMSIFFSVGGNDCKSGRVNGYRKLGRIHIVIFAAVNYLFWIDVLYKCAAPLYGINISPQSHVTANPYFTHWGCVQPLAAYGTGARHLYKQVFYKLGVFGNKLETKFRFFTHKL